MYILWDKINANPVLLVNPGFLHYASNALSKCVNQHRLEKRCKLRGCNHKITSEPFEGERGRCEDVRLQERSRQTLILTQQYFSNHPIAGQTV